ncbi:DUF4199 domain-containing protein [Rubrolithibacter danxiaensis]|uniref:DUF4199 domain-containing protein n=1 Tax=Rubrolithibacter danxiaensis TaxID=3390805 RepID=UPI003BF7F5E5
METVLQLKPNLKAEAAKNGAIWAVINIIIFLLVYYVKADLMGSFVWGIIQILLGIALAVYFCMDLRKKAGGFWSFKEALTHIFIMFLVQALIVFFFTILFGKIEPTYVEKMKAITTNTTQQMMEKMGMDQDKIDEVLAQNETAMEKQFNPGPLQILTSVGMIILGYFVGALIFAAIFKKERPFFVQETEE